MPAGLQEQIDELDQLLDQLLQLPIDRAVATPGTKQTQPVPNDAEPAEPILRFPPSGETQELRPPVPVTLTLHEAAPAHLDDEVPDNNALLSLTPVELEVTKPIALPVESVTTPSTLPPIQQPPTADSIPWLDDEPLPVQTGTGPRVEIVQGPEAEIVRPADWVEPSPDNPAPNRPRSLIFRILWACTWLFDQTAGCWFPFLRRPAVKFHLGLVGVALLAISIYIVWQGLKR